MIVTILIVLGVAAAAAMWANATANSANLPDEAVAYLTAPLKQSTTFKQGGHVMFVSGILIPCADTSGGSYAGRFFDADITTTSAADGTSSGKYVPPTAAFPFKQFVCSGADNTWNGQLVSFTNDYTVAINSGTTNHVIAGRVVQVLSATAVVVNCMDRFAGNPAAN